MNQDWACASAICNEYFNENILINIVMSLKGSVFLGENLTIHIENDKLTSV